MAGMKGTAMTGAHYAGTEDAGKEVTPGGAIVCVDCAGIASPETALTLVRFGEWTKVLALPVPSSFGEAPDYNKAMYYYAQAMALLATGQHADDAVNAAVSAAAGDFFSKDVVRYELEAAKAWRVDHNASAAIASLDAAIAAVDLLPYVEPPRFYY